MASYLRSLNDDFVKQVAVMCCVMFRPGDPAIVDNPSHTYDAVNSVESALEVLERGLTLNLRNLDAVSSDVDRHSKVVDRIHVVLRHRRDLTDLGRALVLEQRAFFTVRRRLVHALLSTGIHLHLSDVCKTRPETLSFKDELAWKRQFDDVIKVVKEELVAAEGAFVGIAEEERGSRQY